jgi:hypothetical protein
VHTEFVPEEAQTFPPTQKACCKVRAGDVTADDDEVCCAAASAESHSVSSMASPNLLGQHQQLHNHNSTAVTCVQDSDWFGSSYKRLGVNQKCCVRSTAAAAVAVGHLPGHHTYFWPRQEVQVSSWHAVQPTGWAEDRTHNQRLLCGTCRAPSGTSELTDAAATACITCARAMELCCSWWGLMT